MGIGQSHLNDLTYLFSDAAHGIYNITIVNRREGLETH